MTGQVIPQVVSPPGRRSHVYGLIACQGDSLTYGSRDPDGMSYPLYLGRLLSDKYQQVWATVSFAVPRDGWAEIWRRNYHDLLTVPEAGRRYFNLGRNASYEAAKRGDLPVIRIGSRLRVSVAALERMLADAGRKGA